MAGLNNSFPKGIPYIIGNEAAERYSFYGMKAIFVVFLTKFISNAAGELAVFDETDAKFWLHIFIFSTYGLSLAGAFLADVYLGKYKTIISLSIVYCIGHFILALFETKMGFLFGCSLIAIGAGSGSCNEYLLADFSLCNLNCCRNICFYFFFRIFIHSST